MTCQTCQRTFPDVITGNGYCCLCGQQYWACTDGKFRTATIETVVREIYRHETKEGSPMPMSH